MAMNVEELIHPSGVSPENPPDLKPELNYLRLRDFMDWLKMKGDALPPYSAGIFREDFQKLNDAVLQALQGFEKMDNRLKSQQLEQADFHRAHQNLNAVFHQFYTQKFLPRAEDFLLYTVNGKIDSPDYYLLVNEIEKKVIKLSKNIGIDPVSIVEKHSADERDRIITEMRTLYKRVVPLPSKPKNSNNVGIVYSAEGKPIIIRSFNKKPRGILINKLPASEKVDSISDEALHVNAHVVAEWTEEWLGEGENAAVDNVTESGPALVAEAKFENVDAGDDSREGGVNNAFPSKNMLDFGKIITRNRVLAALAAGVAISIHSCFDGGTDKTHFETVSAPIGQGE